MALIFSQIDVLACFSATFSHIQIKLEEKYYEPKDSLI